MRYYRKRGHQATPPQPRYLEGASCIGMDAFTTEGLPSDEIQILLNICAGCPVLDRCRKERDAYRFAMPWEFSHFNGVWGGVGYSHGRQRKTMGRNPRVLAI